MKREKALEVLYKSVPRQAKNPRGIKREKRTSGNRDGLLSAAKSGESCEKESKMACPVLGWLGIKLGVIVHNFLTASGWLQKRGASGGQGVACLVCRYNNPLKRESANGEKARRLPSQRS